jgi:hypothetical protein
MIRTQLRSTFPLLLALLATMLVGGVAACGDDDDEDAQAVIDRAFSEPIDSGDVSLSADLAFEGSEQLSEPFRVQVSGPFQSNGPEQIPSFDFDVALQGGGAEVPPLGVISTGDNVFIEVQGTAYEVGEDVVAEQNRQLAQQPAEESGLGALGVDPREWIVDAQVEGDADVAGEPTTHVSAGVDVPALVGDLNAAAQQASEVGAGPAPELTEEQQAQIEEALEDPTFDVFAGEEDGRLRRLTTTLGFQVPETAQAGLGGATGGTLTFSMELANVDGDQEIEAPDDAQPLEDLAQQLGGLGGVLGEQQAPGDTLTTP